MHQQHEHKQERSYSAQRAILWCCEPMNDREGFSGKMGVVGTGSKAGEGSDHSLVLRFGVCNLAEERSKIIMAQEAKEEGRNP
jgi:hypothetical protein